MKLTPLTFIGILCLSASAIAQQNDEAVKQRILAQAKSMSAEDYAFTRTVRTEAITGGKTEQTVNVEKYDPTKPADSRWVLVSVNGAAPAADALDKFRKESAKRRVPGYFRLANYFGSAATTSKDAQGRTVFHFSGLPKDSVIVVGSDVSQNAAADVTANIESDPPFAEQVRLTVKAMRIKLVMKLNSYESSARYRLGPEGKPLLAEQTSDMSGSGLGQEGRVHTVSTYSDYRLVRGQR